jgi:hypothetical protein
VGKLLPILGTAIFFLLAAAMIVAAAFGAIVLITLAVRFGWTL